jgi:hypothetical protein
MQFLPLCSQSQRKLKQAHWKISQWHFQIFLNYNIFIRIYESAFCLQKKTSYLNFACVCVWRKDCYSILDRFFKAILNLESKYTWISFKFLFLFQWIQLGPKSFACTICDNYTSNRKDNVIRHGKLKHTDLKPFPCSECSYSGKTKQNLLKHIEGNHCTILHLE